MILLGSHSICLTVKYIYVPFKKMYSYEFIVLEAVFNEGIKHILRIMMYYRETLAHFINDITVYSYIEE